MAVRPSKNARKTGSASVHPKEPKLTHRRGIGGMVLESVMIVFSILFALGLENWNEHRKESSRCRTALRLIQKEIGRNRDETADLLNTHKELTESLVAASETLTGKRKGPVRLKVDVAFATHRSAVFDAAMVNRSLAPLGWEALLPVMECYTSHAWLQKLENTWLESVLALDPYGDRKLLSRQALRLAGILQTYREIEEQTVAQYDSAAAAVERALGKGE
jgi:hypothetical protein